MKQTINSAMLLGMVVTALATAGCADVADQDTVENTGEASQAIRYPGQYNKRTFDNDYSPYAPSLKWTGATKLVMAWTGTGDGRLNLQSSSDCLNFANKYTSPTSITSLDGPILASDGSTKTYLGWTSKNNYPKVAPVNFNGSTMSLGSEYTLSLLPSNSKPGLVSLSSSSSVVFVAVRDASTNEIRVGFSRDRFGTFDYNTLYSTGQYTDRAPSLAATGTTVYMAWKGNGNTLLNVATVNYDSTHVTGLSSKKILDMGYAYYSNAAPAIQAFPGSLYIAYAGATNHNIYANFSSDGGLNWPYAPSGSSEYTDDTQGPGLGACIDPTTLTAIPMVAWEGRDNHKLNLAMLYK